MTDETLTAFEADPEAIVEDEEAAVEAEDLVDPEPEEAKDEKQRETSRERRERDKASRQRLRDELAGAQAALEKANARNAELTGKASGLQKPQESDYADYAEYLAGVVEWNSEKKTTANEQKSVTAQADAAQQEAARIQRESAALLEQNWQSQAQEAVARYADFQYVIGQPGLFPKGSALVSMIQQSDVAADLAYRIAGDRLLHDRLKDMHPIDAARELGRLEATIALPKPRTATQAPDPITPVRGTSRAALDPEKLSMEAWIAKRKSGEIK